MCLCFSQMMHKRVPVVQRCFQIFLWEWPGSVRQWHHHWCSPWCQQPHRPSGRVGSGLTGGKNYICYRNLLGIYEKEMFQRCGIPLHNLSLNYKKDLQELMASRIMQKHQMQQVICHLCRGSRRGIVRLDLLWWSRRDQTGWHWDPRTHGQNTTPPLGREGHKNNKSHDIQSAHFHQMLNSCWVVAHVQHKSIAVTVWMVELPLLEIKQ